MAFMRYGNAVAIRPGSMNIAPSVSKGDHVVVGSGKRGIVTAIDGDDVEVLVEGAEGSERFSASDCRRG